MARPKKRPIVLDDAECAKLEDPDIMFQEHGPGEVEAKEVCMRCPVMEICREAALRQRERYGVWGGMSASDRASVWRRTQQRSA